MVAAAWKEKAEVLDALADGCELGTTSPWSRAIPERCLTRSRVYSGRGTNTMQALDDRTSLELTAVIWREGEDFVSLCPELGVASCGSTLENAAAMLEEAVDLFLTNARELGLLDETVGALVPGQRWTTSIRVAV
jgi:predicted RNase H-like HicB family nuclease